MQPRLRRAQLDGYLARVIDRDFPEAGRSVRNPAALRRWMDAYAAATSTAASYDAIRDAATAGDGNKPAKTTTQPYRDTLERLWILEPVPGWLPTHNHLREQGVAAAPTRRPSPGCGATRPRCGGAARRRPPGPSRAA